MQPEESGAQPGRPGDAPVPDAAFEAEISAAKAALIEAREMLEDVIETVGEIAENTTDTQDAGAAP